MRLRLLGGAVLVAAVLLVVLPWWRREQAATPEGAVAVVSATKPLDDAGSSRRTDLPVPPVRNVVPLPPSKPDAGPPRTQSLKLRVSNSAGTVVKGAKVSLWRPNTSRVVGGESVREVTTDESGRCAVLFTSPEEEFIAEHESYGSSGFWGIDEARALLDERDELPIALHYRDTIRGTVRSADGAPADRSWVTCRLVEPGHTSGGRPRGLQRTGVASGRFEFSLESGTYELSATNQDGATTQSVRVSLPGSPTSGIDLIFPQAPVVHGTVKSPDGQPLAAAEVVWWYSGPLDSSDTAQGSQPLTTRGSREGIRRVSSDSHGDFAIAVASPGQYSLLGTAAGFACGPVVTVTLTEEQPCWPEPVALTLSWFGTIGGTLTWENGAPIPGVTVRALPSARFCEALPESVESCYGSAESVTDVQGGFELIGLSELGSYLVCCNLDAEEELERPYDPVHQRIVVAPEVAPGTQGLRLIASESTFEGLEIGVVVLDALTQQPADNVHMLLLIRRNSGPFHDNDRWLRGQVRKGPDGRFLIHGALPGELYALQVDGRLGDIELATTVTDWFTASEAMDDVVVEMLRTGTLEVFVVDPAGAPIRGAHVRVAWSEGPSVWAPLASNDAGRALYKPVAPGHYRVTAELDDHVVERVVEVASGARETVTLTWPSEH